MKTKIVTCEVCGQDGARIKRASRTSGKGDDIVVIDNVPTVVCPHCGESYMTAATMQEVDRLKLHKRSLKAQRHAPVLNFV